MIEVLFTCVMNNVMKEIAIGKEKGCTVLIDDKQVGSAQHNPEFCTGLAAKVKQDMERKGYKCEQPKGYDGTQGNK